MRMYLPRRVSASILRPATPALNSSASGCRTIAGNSDSTSTIRRPTRCGRRSAAIVSTSGSSGTLAIVGAGMTGPAGRGKPRHLRADYRQLLHVSPVGPVLGLDLDAGLQLVSAGHDPRHHLG